MAVEKSLKKLTNVFQEGYSQDDGKKSQKLQHIRWENSNPRKLFLVLDILKTQNLLDTLSIY